MQFLLLIVLGCQNSDSAKSVSPVDQPPAELPHNYDGAPGDFIGNWEGRCTVDSVVACKAEMRVNIIADRFYLQMGYSIGDSFYGAVFDPHRIQKNTLIEIKTSLPAGAIGSDGFYLTRENVGKVTIDLKEEGEIILSIAQLSGNKVTHIAGSMKRTSKRPCDSFGCLGENEKP
ncbi:hypothetical protein [Bdellovibrio bacteriovorus]|uniref:hypothetical protein n=1 Tax=Bdellovibrio TaxID=958 RepID=UPI0035A8818F